MMLVKYFLKEKIILDNVMLFSAAVGFPFIQFNPKPRRTYTYMSKLTKNAPEVAKSSAALILTYFIWMILVSNVKCYQQSWDKLNFADAYDISDDELIRDKTINVIQSLWNWIEINN